MCLYSAVECLKTKLIFSYFVYGKIQSKAKVPILMCLTE
jgi:hypothetical protein